MRMLDSWAQFGGDTGDVSPILFQTGGHNMPCPPHFFLFRFCIWRGFENKCYVCHVLREELFMLDGRQHSQLYVETEFFLVPLLPLVYKF